jgi:hypothetical protein
VPTVSLTLVAVLAGPPAAPVLDLEAAAVDPRAAADGLRARAGADLDGWTISVRDADVPGEVDAVLRAPDGREQRRRLVLAGPTREDRSRELAASLALLVEEEATAAAGPAPPPPRPPPPPRGWVAVGPRLGVQGAPPLGGVDVAGAALLLRDHLQPMLRVGWAGTASEGLRVQEVRLGGGAAAGASLRGGRLWLGGHVLLHALWLHAQDGRRGSTWTSSTEVGGTLQVFGGRWVLGVQTGVDLALPPVTLLGSAARIRRGPAMWVLGVSFGLVFGGLRN